MPKPPKPRLKRVPIPTLNPVAIGKRIKSARKHRHWTQKDLAYLSGVYFSCLSHYETGRRVPPTAALVKLATVLRRSIDWLATGRWRGRDAASRSVCGQGGDCGTTAQAPPIM